MGQWGCSGFAGGLVVAGCVVQEHHAYRDSMWTDGSELASTVCRWVPAMSTAASGQVQPSEGIAESQAEQHQPTRYSVSQSTCSRPECSMVGASLRQAVSGTAPSSPASLQPGRCPPLMAFAELRIGPCEDPAIGGAANWQQYYAAMQCPLQSPAGFTCSSSSKGHQQQDQMLVGAAAAESQSCSRSQGHQ